MWNGVDGKAATIWGGGGMSRVMMKVGFFNEFFDVYWLVHVDVKVTIIMVDQSEFDS